MDLCWRILKTALCNGKARTRQSLDTASIPALTTVAASDARSWFISYGDALASVDPGLG
jgi:hypothetical protein